MSSCSARRYRGITLANLITLVRARRQLKLENRALVDSPRHPDAAVMAFDNGTADGKANSHATLLGREHRVENMIVVGWVDTRSGILDGHVNKIWLPNAGSYAQYSQLSCLHCLNGVHDQVQDDLLQLIADVGREPTSALCRFPPMARPEGRPQLTRPACWGRPFFNAIRVVSWRSFEFM